MAAVFAAALPLVGYQSVRFWTALIASTLMVLGPRVGLLPAVVLCLIAEGHLARPPLFQICLGIPWGAPATPEALVAMRARLPEDAIWSAFGIGREEFPILAVAAGMGGNVRVGLEDSLWDGPGKLAETNAAQVRRVRSIIEGLGLSVASPDEAREILALKGGDKVAF